MELLSTVALLAALLVADAYVTCKDTNSDSGTCDGEYCWHLSEPFQDKEYGCTDGEWCKRESAPYDNCRTFTNPVRWEWWFCCCSSRDDCGSKDLRNSMGPTVTTTATEAPVTTAAATPTDSTASAAATGSTMPPLLCIETADEWQGLPCPSRVCYSLFGGAQDDYGCADRLVVLPADVVVAVCSDKEHDYCFDTTDDDDADVQLCCCSSDTSNCNRHLHLD